MRPTLQVLTPDQIEQILADAIRILAETGIEVRGAALRQRLLDAGLPLDAAGRRVLFPPDVVTRALASAPRAITLYDRAGQPHAELAGDRVHFVPGSSGLYLFDHCSGARRLALTADFVDYVRLADGLEHIAYLATAFSTADVPPEIADAWRLYLVLTQAQRPVVSGAFTEHGVPRMAEMLTLFRRDRADLARRPLAIFTVTATGNFRYSEDSCQNLLDCVEWGIPIEVVPVTLMGLVAPVTVMGAAVFHTVDVLAGIVMAQVVRPGAPVIFGGAPAAFHMRESTAPMSAVEAMRLDLAYVAVAKRLGLPTQSYLGMSENRAVDAQAGAESFGGALLAALAGINSVSGPGMLDYTIAFSLPKLLLDDELCGQALHLARPFTVENDLPAGGLAAEQLAEGNLLTAAHTLAHYRRALYTPGPIWDRQGEDSWVKGGRTTLMQRAVAEVERRLAACQPTPTDPAIERQLRDLLLAGVDLAEDALPAISPPRAGTVSQPRGHQRRTR